MEKESLNNAAAQPGKIETLTREQVLAMAKRIWEMRGEPPYKHRSTFFPGSDLTDDEMRIISDFVTYWRPFFTIEEKSTPPEAPKPVELKPQPTCMKGETCENELYCRDQAHCARAFRKIMGGP